jgi:ribosomal protein L22
MGKIVLDEKEVNELMDTFDFNKSVYLQELQKLNTFSQKNIEDLKVLSSNLNFKSLQKIETEIKQISQFSKNIDVSDFKKNLKNIIDNASYKLELENNELKIQTQNLNNNVQNLKEVIPQAEEHIRNLLVKAKEKLEKEISLTSRFLRMNTLFVTFISGLLFGGLGIYIYHLSYIKKYDENIVFLLMNSDKQFIKSQIDKASTFFAGYNSQDELIIKIHNDKKED